jgi:hypothetical protein
VLRLFVTARADKAAAPTWKAELALLRAGGVDAVCVASAEEAGLVVGGDYWPATAPPFVVALGDEAAAAVDPPAKEKSEVESELEQLDGGDEGGGCSKGGAGQGLSRVLRLQGLQ